ncbi:MAG: ATP-binding domain-containing protein [Zoogloeaceae bacterium]|jgi:superfamily I DNA/RNA helicase|nr:ATP-binding domain-containing protein [Zoogloeaceae bacterium]
MNTNPNRARVFKLPGIHELSKGQDAALALPLEGQHLIVGGPGTGKSVVALLRARRLAREKKPYLFLVYNHLLRQSNLHLFADDPKRLETATWDAWFRGQYRVLMQEQVPTLAPAPGKTFRPIDWAGVERAVQSLPGDRYVDPLHLVIDEGQDMPPAFYRTLIHWGFENFYVVADQNQQIYPEQCSSRREIEDMLALSPGMTLELTDNYRNAFSVARLARAFCGNDPASPPPALPPESRRSLGIPLLLHYGPTYFGSLIDRILRFCDKDPRKLIGLITPDNKTREKFFNALTGAHPALDHEKPPIQTYAVRQQAALDFGQGGLMVINAQSCKGLEFDYVILADIDQHWERNPYLKMLFYVMVSRAREYVILLRTGEANPEVEQLLPVDPGILINQER